jgi:hypothetical protein
VRWVLFVVAVAACGHAGSSAGSGGFRVFYPDVGARGLVLRAHQRIQAKPTATCTHADGREAHWAITGGHVVAGTLPPGLVLEDGAIAGEPKESGQWKVTVELRGVTCAGKTLPDQTLEVPIVVTAGK